jgi:hypothetical protein
VAQARGSGGRSAGQSVGVGLSPERGRDDEAEIWSSVAAVLHGDAAPMQLGGGL